MTCEITAVNHRNVMRPQGLDAARVVPVEEMSAKLLQLFHAREGEFDSFEQLNQAHITKVVSGERRQQQQADVRRRRSMRDNERVFLKIIRRQPMIFVAYKRLEEAPRPPRNDATRAHVFGRKLNRAFDTATAGPKSNQRRKRPSH